MPRPTVIPPDWATAGNYAAPGSVWDGHARIDDAIMAILAPGGVEPVDPTPAPGMNSFLQALARGVRYMLQESAGIGVGRYGDGSDGDVTITAGTTTLTRDMYYNNLTITGTGVLRTAGFRVFVKGTCTIQAGGILHNDGTGGGLEGGGANPWTAGAGAPGTTSTSLLGGGDGAAGTNLANTGGAQAVALVLRAGGAGGAGGSSGAGDAGGPTQIGTAPPPETGGFRHYPRCVALDFNGLADNNTYRIGGGVGGSSGGNDAAGGGQGSGGGGGGGGVVCLVARVLVLAAGAIIRANGGNGGSGFHTGATGAGGGGGGGGGLVVIVTDWLQDSGATIQANGGTGGAGAGPTGVAGSAGGAGTIINLAAA